MKEEYTEAVFLRYKRAPPRSKKTAILDEFCDTLGYNRKCAIRVLRTFKCFTRPKPKKRGRSARYHKEEILTPIKRIWLAANLPCSKRLKVILPLWLAGYSETFEPLSLEVVKALESISSAAIDRVLKPARAQYKTHGRSTTKPGTLLRKQIPIQTNQWDESRPGFFEADTVAHCGQSLSGVFAYTIDFVDIATGWTEQRAIWGKGETNVLDQITSKHAFPSPCSASTVTMDQSFSIIICFGTSPKRKYGLPGAGPTTRMTMPTSSKRTGVACGNGSAMIDSMIPVW